MNLIQDFLTEAERRPQQTAIIDKAGRSISYQALARRSADLAASFAESGIGKGDRVLIGTFPGIELYAGLAALWRLGAVAVFPEPAMGLAGFRHAARVTRPRALLASFGVGLLAALFSETRAIPLRLNAGKTHASGKDYCETLGGEDPALISFTSGSSGAPKAMERSHGLMRAQHQALASLIASDRPEIDIVAFPAFVLTCIGHGSTAVMPNWNLRRHDRMPPEKLIRLAANTGATRLLVPPVVVSRLLETELPESVHRVLTGGGPLYPDIARQFLTKHPNVGLTNVYGSTEAEPIAHIHLEDLTEPDWEAAGAGRGLPAGPPVAEVRLRFVEDEIQVAGPHVNRGYLDPDQDRDTKIAEGETIWHRTGDAGRLDEAGRLWLLGRHGASANGLFAFSVETAARLWPGVTGAAFAVDPEGAAVLFLSGDASNLSVWRARAAAIGTIEICPVAKIPMDRRHRSKPDLKHLLHRHR